MDTELSTILARMRTAAKKPLSPKQKQAAEGLAKKGRQLDKGLAEATQKQHEQVVEEFIKESKQSPIPKEDIADVEDRIRTLLEENCDLE